ncbi:MAG: hypothetical protein VKK04_21870 [Synechococcales bacterium]|nr:hypothetical protein [Synechococcales bacterium]
MTIENGAFSLFPISWMIASKAPFWYQNLQRRAGKIGRKGLFEVANEFSCQDVTPAGESPKTPIEFLDEILKII